MLNRTESKKRGNPTTEQLPREQRSHARAMVALNSKIGLGAPEDLEIIKDIGVLFSRQDIRDHMSMLLNYTMCSDQFFEDNNGKERANFVFFHSQLLLFAESCHFLFDDDFTSMHLEAFQKMREQENYKYELEVEAYKGFKIMPEINDEYVKVK